MAGKVSPEMQALADSIVGQDVIGRSGVFRVESLVSVQRIPGFADVYGVYEAYGGPRRIRRLPPGDTRRTPDGLEFVEVSDVERAAFNIR